MLRMWLLIIMKHNLIGVSKVIGFYNSREELQELFQKEALETNFQYKVPHKTMEI